MYSRPPFVPRVQTRVGPPPRKPAPRVDEGPAMAAVRWSASVLGVVFVLYTALGALTL